MATPKGPEEESARIGPLRDVGHAKNPIHLVWGKMRRRWSQRVLPNDALSPDGSRWRLQTAKGGLLTAQLRPPTIENACCAEGKQALSENRSFASKDGWDRVLRPLVDVLWPLRRGQKGCVHASARYCLAAGGFGGT